MTSYLVLPRPGDLVKMLILPAGFLVGAACRGLPEPSAVLRALLVWACLELLVYQARYQWNDIRGFDADQRHPEGDRGRLPGPVEQRRSRFLWSSSTAVAKVVAAVGACSLLGWRWGAGMALLAVGVFGLASCYEMLRSASTGRSGEVPSPLTPGVVAIWVVIGGGYALRAVTGLGLAVDLLEPPALLATAIVTCWGFGTAWITSRWALEATAFAERGPGGELSWHAKAAQAKEHQLGLVRWLPTTTTVDPRHWRAVREGTPWRAPWNTVGAVTGGCAAAAGVLLVAPSSDPGDVATVALAGSVGSVAALVAGRLRPAGTALGAALVFSAVLLTGTGVEPASTAPWLAVSLAQLCYLGQHRASLGGLLRRRSAGEPVPPSATATAAVAYRTEHTR